MEKQKEKKKILVFIEFSEGNSQQKMYVAFFSVFRSFFYNQSLFFLAFVVGFLFEGLSMSRSSFKNFCFGGVLFVKKVHLSENHH